MPQNPSSIEVKQEIVRVAQAALSDDIDLFKGCELLNRLHRDLMGSHGHDPDFNIFIGIWSDTDQFAFGEERKHWEPTALAENDRKRKEFEDFHMKGFNESCKILISKFEKIAT